MNKLYGSITGLLIGVIAAVIWIFVDTVVNKDCSSLYVCSTSRLFTFGPLYIVLILGGVGLLLGLLIGWWFDKKRPS